MTIPGVSHTPVPGRGRKVLAWIMIMIMIMKPCKNGLEWTRTRTWMLTTSTTIGFPFEHGTGRNRGDLVTVMIVLIHLPKKKLKKSFMGHYHYNLLTKELPLSNRAPCGGLLHLVLTLPPTPRLHILIRKHHFRSYRYHLQLQRMITTMYWGNERSHSHSRTFRCPPETIQTQKVITPRCRLRRGLQKRKPYIRKKKKLIAVLKGESLAVDTGYEIIVSRPCKNKPQTPPCYGKVNIPCQQQQQQQHHRRPN
jgi:hypothetical protein